MMNYLRWVMDTKFFHLVTDYTCAKRFRKLAPGFTADYSS